MDVNILYRSKKISVPLLEAMSKSGAWEAAGIEVSRLEYVEGAAVSDPELIDGTVDFIFGSHISPYIHKARGVPFVYLGQSVNWCTDMLVTKERVSSLSWLRGKRIAEEKTDDNSHPFFNHKLYLREGGVDLTEVSFVSAREEGQGRKAFELVLDGAADAAFIMPPNDVYAEEAGLTVNRLPYLPMVHATTLTTMWPTRHERPELCKAVIRTVRHGIRFFKSERDVMINEVMPGVVADKLNITNARALERLYDVAAEILDESLYPSPAAVENAYLLALLKEPWIQGKVHPLELWDTSLLREVDEMEA